MERLHLLGIREGHEPPIAFDVSSTAFDIDGPKRSTDYTTTSNFLLDSRPRLWWRNASGVSGVKKAEISAVLAALTYGV